MRVIYLHGFASSPKSSKGTFLAGKLREQGIELESPDFNEPDFSTLTITRMLEQVDAVLDRSNGPVILIGSSLGGFVAVQTAVRRPERVARMILLAPALDFSANRLRDLGDRGLEEWKASGQLNVFHYAFGRTVPVHYDLYADCCRYECGNESLDMPILIFQGRRDSSVSPEAVERWARQRPNVELHLLDDDHQLAASLNYIWERGRAFMFPTT